MFLPSSITEHLTAKFQGRGPGPRYVTADFTLVYTGGSGFFSMIIQLWFVRHDPARGNMFFNILWSTAITKRRSQGAKGSDKPNFLPPPHKTYGWYILHFEHILNVKSLNFQKWRYVLRLKWDFRHLSVFSFAKLCRELRCPRSCRTWDLVVIKMVPLPYP